MDSPSIMCTPPTIKSSKKFQDDDVIIWDDSPNNGHHSSSPFVTEVTDRHASGRMDQMHKDAEIDAIFADTEHEERGSNKADSGDAMIEDKENVAVGTVKHDKFRPSTPDTQRKSTSRQAILREQDSMSMPPPSTTRRTNSSSPKKASFTQKLRDGQTPKAFKGGRETPQTQRATAPSEDFSLYGEETNVDDTCFSTFSAVPDMTLFARLGDQQTPRANGWQTPQTTQQRPSSSHSPSPTPRRNTSPAKDSNTTSLLIDFTQQMESFSAQAQPTPSQRGRLSPSRTEPNLLSYLNTQRSPTKGPMIRGTPAKQSNLLNLLDFELPPPPTPRSTPAFSVREVESLKSSFQSQISSIKAKLSGKEAEVDSLKKALEDAERRVTEAQDAAREEKLKREQAEQERADWQKRGEDVDNVLKTFKEEVLKSEAEKEELERRAEENGRRTADLEAQNLDLQARLASIPVSENGEAAINGAEIQRLVQAQVDAKIEGVSRELHAVYKKKHETKVATLKKSYEAKSDKKCADLQVRIDELAKQNEDLSMAKDATFSGELSEEHAAMRHATEKYRAEIEEQNARLVGLGEEMKTIRSEHSRLLLELEKERVEKGELVAAVDEMLSLQSGEGASVIEDFRKSVQRSSGLKPPGAITAAPESRIARSGLARAGSGKSKMMSSIERMGNARGM